MNPKNIALVIPVLVVDNRFENIPIIPFSLNPNSAALYRALPNEVIGILLPTNEKLVR